MFKTILYPTDFSEVSEKAFDYIKQLKEAGAEKVIVLHVIDQRTINAVHYHMENSQKLEINLTAQAEEELEEIKKKLVDVGLEIETVLQTGFPAREILKAEKDNEVSVIVIGSHGRSNMEEMLLGSISEKVIRKCEKPVLVVKR